MWSVTLNRKRWKSWKKFLGILFNYLNGSLITLQYDLYINFLPQKYCELVKYLNCFLKTMNMIYHFICYNYVCIGFPGGSEVKASACNAGDLGSIPGLGRSPGGGHPTHSSILACRIPWTEEPDQLQSIWLQSRTWLKWLSTHTWVWGLDFLFLSKRHGMSFHLLKFSLITVSSILEFSVCIQSFTSLVKFILR